MTKNEALQMCLEYIETDAHERKYVRHAIKAALQQPVQEPVAWRDPTNVDPGQGCTYKKERHEKWPHIYMQALYTAPPAAQPEQEPVAWATVCDDAISSLSLTKTAAELKAENLREKNRGRNFVIEVCPITYPPAAQPVQEPVAWTTMPEATDWDFVSGSKDPTGKLEGKWFPLYTTPPAAQPEQEPVPEKSWVYGTPLLDAMTRDYVPAQRPWQGLTPEDLAQIDTDEFWQVGNHMAIAMAVEDKLKERNNG